MIYSVYSTQCVGVIGSKNIGPFIVQTELIGNVGDTIELEVAYTQEGYYVGDKTQARFLTKMGITSQVQPRGEGRTCTIGFNPVEVKWYGWSHRAAYGFGIGSSVRLGDCAFSPSCPEEIEASMLAFWDIDAWRECENEQTVCKNRLFRSVQTRQDGVLGWLIAYETIFIGADRHSVSTHFTPYPKTWGKGNWTARTIKDAKQMAIDFAAGVS